MIKFPWEDNHEQEPEIPPMTEEQRKNMEKEILELFNGRTE